MVVVELEEVLLGVVELEVVLLDVDVEVMVVLVVLEPSVKLQIKLNRERRHIYKRHSMTYSSMLNNYSLTILDIEELETSSPAAVPRYQFELGKSNIWPGLEQKLSDWPGQGVRLMQGVLKDIPHYLVPGPRLVTTDPHLELLRSPVPVIAIVRVDQLHQVDDLLTAEV